MIPVSEALKELLCRHGMSAGSAGTGRANRLASAPISGEEGQTSERSPTAGKGLQPMGMERTGGSVTPAKFTGLQLVSSNRCFDMASPTRLPRAAMSKHLVLVISR